MFVCMHACMHACMYVCMYARTYVRTHVCMYVSNALRANPATALAALYVVRICDTVSKIWYTLILSELTLRRVDLNYYFGVAAKKSNQNSYQHPSKWFPNRSLRLLIFGVGSILGGLWESLEANLSPKWFQGPERQSFDPLLVAIMETKIDEKLS